MAQVVSFNPKYNIDELKDKIRKVIKDYTKTNQDIHISVVYYEIRTYKKPEKGKKCRRRKRK